MWNAANGTETNSENNNDVWRLNSANEHRWRQQLPILINLISCTVSYTWKHASHYRIKLLCIQCGQDERRFVSSFFEGWWPMWAQYALVCLELITETCLSHEHICRGQMVAFGQLKVAWNSQYRQVSIRNAQTLPLCRQTIFKRGLYTSEGAEINDKVGAILRCLLSSVWYISPWLSPC